MANHETNTDEMNLPEKKHYTYSYEEILECQFQSWYPKFRRSKQNGTNSTPRSIILPLPTNFSEYLLCDGIKLPADATNVSSCLDANIGNSDNEDKWGNEDDEDDGSNDEDEIYSFPEFTEAISQAISKLGGSVLPKLNWSSPKDATWMNGGTLKCKTPGDIYLLLKSSDFIVHDLIHAWDDLKENENCGNSNILDSDRNLFLVLRKWCNLHTSMEFRCFVRSHKIVAISQREHTQCYPHLVSNKFQLRDYIMDFFTDTIQNNFANNTIPNYVFDCYVDKEHRVWIIDFNLWGSRTDSLLYTWEELENIDTNSECEVTSDGIDIIDTTKYPEIRIVGRENEVHHDPLSSYRAPIDTVDLATDSSGMNSFAEFMSKCERPSERDN